MKEPKIREKYKKYFKDVRKGESLQHDFFSETWSFRSDGATVKFYDNTEFMTIKENGKSKCISTEDCIVTEYDADY